MDAQQTLLWLGAVRDMGPEALAAVDLAEAARWLGRAFGVPGELIREPELGSADAGRGLARAERTTTAITALAEALDQGRVS